jgi:beta-glucosidase
MTFPEGFTWGVAAAAHQIEGACTKEGRIPSVWDAFARQPGAIRGGHTGQTACDHYHRYKEDADLIADLGARAYRMSISWSRVMNELGGPNEPGLAFYDRLVDALLERGVEPWVTLFHWDFPLHLFYRGGWLNRDAAQWFADYTQLVVDRLSDRVTHWFTLNEPQVYIDHGHASGIHAPGMRYSDPLLVRVIHHSLLAHGRSVQVIRARARNTPQIGWATVGCSAIPATTGMPDIQAARKATFHVGNGPGWLFNTAWFADPAVLGTYPEDGLALHGKHLPADYEADLSIIHQPLDFYGVNIYQCQYVRADAQGDPQPVASPPGGPYTNIGWPVTPEGLYWGPRFIHERYGLPMYITENGCAAMDWVHHDGKVHDAPRIDFLCRYLCALREAVADGVDVRGYFQWSILDNFEWAQGYDMRFGLVHVDFETQKRTPKDSYDWYRNVIQTHGDSLPEEPAPMQAGFGPGVLAEVPSTPEVAIRTRAPMHTAPSPRGV